MKFFATNRSLDRLSRSVADQNDARDLRHLLCKGGYYFVNMDKYMRYYFETTDRRSMPLDVIVPNSRKCVDEEFLSDERIKAIVVCVHGYNVELHEAFTWFRVLTDTMKNLQEVGDSIVTSPDDLNGVRPNSTAFIGFSWPSNGNVVSYSSDQAEAQGSVTAFASLLARLKETGKKVHLLCHSMGNYLACHTLATLVDERSEPAQVRDWVRPLLKRGKKCEDSEDVKRKDWLIHNYVMIAPDVERRHVTKCDDGQARTDYVGPFYSGLQHLAHRKVNIYSRFDSALRISDYEKTGREVAMTFGERLTFGLLDFRKRNPDLRWEKRLGSAPAPINAPPNFTSVNATELADRKIGHSDHIDSSAIAKRIAEELQVRL